MQIENQAHAVSIGLDWIDGQIEFSVQVPTIGGNSITSDGGDAVEYLVFSTVAPTFPKAYDLMKATLPEKLNLTQLKSVIFSEALAMSDRFPSVIEALFRMYELSASAYAVVTRQSAKETLENQKTTIGTHLSVSMPAMLEFYEQDGYIPRISLSMLYAGMNGFYSTSAATLCAPEGFKPSNDSRLLPGEINRDGKNRNEFMGSALFDRKGMVCELSGEETRLLHLLRGDTAQMQMFQDNLSYQLVSDAPVRLSADVSSSVPILDIAVSLSVTPFTEFKNPEYLAETLSVQLYGLIEKCQKLRIEPFYFAEKAASHFLTLKEWKDYDWLNAFSKAKINITVRLNDRDA